jgi:hypothetical protein
VPDDPLRQGGREAGRIGCPDRGYVEATFAALRSTTRGGRGTCATTTPCSLRFGPAIKLGQLAATEDTVDGTTVRGDIPNVQHLRDRWSRQVSSAGCRIVAEQGKSNTICCRESVYTCV